MHNRIGSSLRLLLLLLPTTDRCVSHIWWSPPLCWNTAFKLLHWAVKMFMISLLYILTHTIDLGDQWLHLYIVRLYPFKHTVFTAWVIYHTHFILLPQQRMAVFLLCVKSKSRFLHSRVFVYVHDCAHSIVDVGSNKCNKCIQILGLMQVVNDK